MLCTHVKGHSGKHLVPTPPPAQAQGQDIPIWPFSEPSVLKPACLLLIAFFSTLVLTSGLQTRMRSFYAKL